MAAIHGWYAFNTTLGNAASTTIDCGTGRRCLILKNTDSSITIWFTLSSKSEVAATASAPNSFPLAAGESLHLEGLDFRYVTAIGASGTPVLKGLAFNRSGD